MNLARWLPLLLVTLPAVAAEAPSGIANAVMEGPGGALHTAVSEAGALIYLRSTDGGRTFAREPVRGALPRARDITLAVGHDGAPWLFYVSDGLVDGADVAIGGSLACAVRRPPGADREAALAWRHEILEPGLRYRRRQPFPRGAFTGAMSPRYAEVGADGRIWLVAEQTGWHRFGAPIFLYTRTPGPSGTWNRRPHPASQLLDERRDPFGGELIAHLRSDDPSAARSTNAVLGWTRERKLSVFFFTRPEHGVAGTSVFYEAQRAAEGGFGPPRRRLETAAQPPGPPGTPLALALDAGGTPHLAYADAGTVYYAPDLADPQPITTLQHVDEVTIGVSSGGVVAVAARGTTANHQTTVYLERHSDGPGGFGRPWTIAEASEPAPLAMVRSGRSGVLPRHLRLRVGATKVLHRDDIALAFTDVTTPLGLDSQRGPVSAGDLDADGRVDLCVGTRAFRQTADGSFAQIPSDAPVEGATAMGDVDGDGDQDLVAVHRTVELHRLVAGELKRQSERAGLGQPIVNGWRAVLADLDADGWLDLLVLNREGNDANLVFRNRGFGRFVDVTERSALRSFEAWSVDAAVEDLDGDGLPEVAIANLSGPSLFRNLGAMRFEKVELQSRALRRCAAVALGDVDDDGDRDLFVYDLDGGSQLLRNDGGLRFVPVPWTKGTRLADPLPQRFLERATAALADLDGDGYLDVYATAPEGPNALLRGSKGLRLGPAPRAERVTPGPAGPHLGAVLVDLDRDGDVDIVSAGVTAVRVYRNESIREDARALASPPRARSSGLVRRLLGRIVWCDARTEAIRLALVLGLLLAAARVPWRIGARTLTHHLGFAVGLALGYAVAEIVLLEASAASRAALLAGILAGVPALVALDLTVTRRRAARRIGRYRLIAKIGTGSWGDVFRARSFLSSRPVAVKLLRPRDTQTDQIAWKRFRREAELASSIDCPHVVKVLEHGEHQGQCYIVMELVDGPSLQERLRNSGPLSIDAAIRLGLEVASALMALHARGILHRDIKASNILLDRDGAARVSDLGIARASGLESLTEAGGVVGTLAYMAPEQTMGVRTDFRSDIFSLGVVLYEALTGRHPFATDNDAALVLAILKRVPTPIRELRPEVPPALAAVVDEALAKKPEARFQSAHAMREALEAAAIVTAGSDGQPPGAGVPGPARVGEPAPTPGVAATPPQGAPGLAGVREPVQDDWPSDIELRFRPQLDEDRAPEDAG